MRKQYSLTLLFACVFVLLAVSVKQALTVEPEVVINEVLVGNASTNIDPDFTNYNGWIELYNPPGGDRVNLAGYFLTTDLNDPTMWEIPSKTFIQDGNYLVIWADEEDSGLHANFELDMDGHDLALFTPGGDLVDSIVLPDDQLVDVSYGRQPDGDSTWLFFGAPTLGASNSTIGLPPVAGEVFPEMADAPELTPDPGLYGTAQSVSITAETGATIRYTLDGSKPTEDSDVYTVPLNISTTTAVRARAWVTGKLPSGTSTSTYVIGEDTDLAVVSIATDPDHMFDNYIGIYVKGRNGTKRCKRKANYNQKWERPASFEVIETDGTRVVGQDVGFEIHGNCTRRLPMKSFEIKARKRYGDKDVDYAFFDDKPLDSYRRLILRSGGQDTKYAMLRDVLAQQLTSGQMDLDRQGYKPALLYINGQFWGIYAIRDKIDEAYVENTYGLKKEKDFDSLADRGKVDAGSADRWNEFYDYLEASNPADPAVYAYIKSQIDMDEYMNYLIAEIYSANTDWLHTNIRWWRAYSDGSRWRWMMYDMDSAFGNRGRSAARMNSMRLAMSKRGRRSYNSLLLRKLWLNPEFQAEFSQRFAAHLNTTYAPDRVVGMIDDMSGAIAPDMPDQIARWRMPRSLRGWNKQVDKLRLFADLRPDAMRSHLKRYLKVSGMTTFTAHIISEGRVDVSGALVDGGYSGLHFLNTPMVLTGVPADGYKFIMWQETGETSPEIQVTLSGPLTRTAVFAKVPPPPQVVINELHYNPATDDELYEFIELVNVDTVAADLSGMFIDGVDFTFPDGATIAPGEYIVIAKTGATYAGGGYQVFDWNDDKSLSNGGELVALIDTYGQTVDEVDYDDGDPWPTTPDGDGPSLSLLYTSLDNSLAESWDASVEDGGTPGAENFPPPQVVINELHYNPATDDELYEFIELVNVDTVAVDLSDMFIEGVDFTFPDGAIIAPGEYIVIAKTGATYEGNGYQVFDWNDDKSLSNGGELVALINAYGQTVDEVDYDDGDPWPTTPDGDGPSLSLLDTSLDNSLAGSWDSSRENGGTPGTENFPPLP